MVSLGREREREREREFLSHEYSRVFVRVQDGLYWKTIL